MGSLIARLYLTEYGDKLSGCILIGTAGPTAAAASAAHLADSIARSRGMTYRSGFLSSLTFKGYNRKIKNPHTVFDWLSRDENVVSFINRMKSVILFSRQPVSRFIYPTC